jgi:DNA-binding CsgD family transcriptional regulator
MNFWDTEMHIVTFLITVFELAMLFFQVIYFLERTNDKKRLMYLILLLFLIAYNVCSGFFPDERIPIPIMLQNILAYLVGFTMSMYVVYYFYKVFDLKHLKFFATYGLVLFLFLPFTLLFVVPYWLTGNLELSRKLTVIIPFFYGLGFIYSTTRALMKKFAEYKKQSDFSADMLYTHAIAAYISMLCWALLPVIVFFGDYQAVEHSVTNAGFLLMSVIYVSSSIRQSRIEYSKLLMSETALKMKVEEKTRQIEQLNEQQKEIFISLAAKVYESVLNNSEIVLPQSNTPASKSVEPSLKMNFTLREIEILKLLIKGQPYKVIADELNISVRTVSKHVSNMFSKAEVTNKVELIHKIHPSAEQPLLDQTNFRRAVNGKS